ncbi:MAG: GNAT family N-acetyltransferase [Candidatus Omnitrophota bacterium]
MIDQANCKNIVFDEWLASVLHRGVYTINVDQSFVEGDGKELILNLQSKDLFLYSKVPVSQTLMVHFLENLQFNLIETSICFRKTNFPKYVFSGNAVIRFADASDKSQLVKVAGQSFAYSRFHVDHHFSQEAANKIKADWAQNYFFDKRGDSMVVAVVDGVVRGFLQILEDSSDSFVIDLIAVDKEFRHKGLASDMISYAQRERKGCCQIRVTTQLVNLPSVRLYEKMGFVMEAAYYVFHYHSKNLKKK